MKTWMKILIALVVIGIIGAWAGYEFVYNKPHTDYERAEPDFTLPAKTLYNDFKANSEAAGHKYGGKVVEIKGKLTSIEEADSLVIGVFAFEKGMFGDEGVRVTMLPNHSDRLKKHPLTDEIVLKGFCSGYNDSDVILESGSIVK